jgi:hypothetical protein
MGLHHGASTAQRAMPLRSWYQSYRRIRDGSFQAQWETYFDMQMQFLQAQIGISAAQVAQLKADAVQTTCCELQQWKHMLIIILLLAQNVGANIH